MINQEIVYWVAISELLNLKTSEKNSIVIEILHNHRMKFEEFFNLSLEEKINIFKFESNVVEEIEKVQSQISSIAFQVEDIYNQGVEIIPLTDPAYPERYKKLLKRNCPMLLYIKGDRELLNDKIAAVVGSRDVSIKGAEFTENVVRKCVDEGYTIASGYARGVDRIAHDCAIKNGGKSIAIIPQGISGFKSELKKLYPYIMEGKALVVSTFPWKATWTVGRAMERNKYVYGIAETIYVAESGSSGGTWSGAIQGIKNNQDIYVRYAGSDEKCANNKLIAQGAKPVDIKGNILVQSVETIGEELDVKMENILDTLKNKKMSAEEITRFFNLHVSPYDVIKKLTTLSNIKASVENKQLLFSVTSEQKAEQISLF